MNLKKGLTQRNNIMKKTIKKSILIFTSMLLISFTACAKSKSAGKKNAEVQETEPVVTVNPEIDKLSPE